MRIDGEAVDGEVVGAAEEGAAEVDEGLDVAEVDAVAGHGEAEVAAAVDARRARCGDVEADGEEADERPRRVDGVRVDGGVVDGREGHDAGAPAQDVDGREGREGALGRSRERDLDPAMGLGRVQAPVERDAAARGLDGGAQLAVPLADEDGPPALEAARVVACAGRARTRRERRGRKKRGRRPASPRGRAPEMTTWPSSAAPRAARAAKDGARKWRTPVPLDLARPP